MKRWLLLGGLIAAGCAGNPPAYEARPQFQPGALDNLVAAIQAASAHERHAWRDTPAQNTDGTLNVYVEIGRGDSDKNEYSMADNGLVVDRVLNPELNGYPVSYGFVPQTLGYDGDPLDALVLGPRLEPGQVVAGEILGVMRMDDEKGADPKIVVAPVSPAGGPAPSLSSEEKARVGAWFDGYKRFEEDKWAKVTGWGDEDAARRILAETHDPVKEALRARK